MAVPFHEPSGLTHVDLAQALAYCEARLAEVHYLPGHDAHDYLDHHRPPADFVSAEKSIWHLGGGRGSGKTYSAAIYFDHRMRSKPGMRGRIIAPTIGEALQSCVYGNSGLKALFPDLKVSNSEGVTRVVWPNGSSAIVMGVWTNRDVRKLRALGNSELDWFEEFCALPYMRDTWDQARFGRRIGQPQALITTTPTAHPFYAEVLALTATVTTHGTMFDNPHLPDSFKAEILEQYEGTSLYGQEVLGLVLTDVDGALFTSENLNRYRILLGDAPTCTLRGVGVDPATGPGTTGIIVGGSFQMKSPSGKMRWHVGALDDYSKTDAMPEEWGRAVVQAFLDWECDFVVAERNQGGRMVASTIKNAADNWDTEDGSTLTVPVKLVHAADGKQPRMQPISMLHEQGRGHIVSRLPLLENELTTWVPGMESPDRLDAYAWVGTELSSRFRGRGKIGGGG